MTTYQSLGVPRQTPFREVITGKAIRMATATGDGLVSDKPSKETLEAFALFRDTAKQMYGKGEAGSQDGAPFVVAFDAAFKLMWGTEAFEQMRTIDDPPEESTDAATRRLFGGTEGAEVKEPGFAAMSLKAIYETGRCSKPEFTRMSLAPASDRKVFIESRSAIRPDVFDDYAKENAAETDRLVNLALGRKK